MSKSKYPTVTAILLGRGGELDRVTFTPRFETFTLNDLLQAVDRQSGGWTLGDGDTITIRQDD